LKAYPAEFLWTQRCCQQQLRQPLTSRYLSPTTLAPPMFAAGSTASSAARGGTARTARGRAATAGDATTKAFQDSDITPPQVSRRQARSVSSGSEEPYLSQQARRMPSNLWCADSQRHCKARCSNVEQSCRDWPGKCPPAKHCQSPREEGYPRNHCGKMHLHSAIAWYCNVVEDNFRSLPNACAQKGRLSVPAMRS
jgi:hypothetical protein